MALNDGVLMDRAKSMQAAGESYATIFRTLAESGASDVAMLRAAMQLEGIGAGDAKQLLADNGFPQAETMIVVDENDSLYNELFGSGH